MNKILIILTLVLFGITPAIAGIDGLFGIELSKPFPVKPKHAVTTSKNTQPYVFLSPVPDNYEIQHFQDVRVVVSQITKKVARITAETAYLTKENCESEKKILITILDNWFPLNKSSTGKYVWRYKEDSRNRFAAVRCSFEANAPFPVLMIDVVDMDETDKIEKHFIDSISKK